MVNIRNFLLLIMITFIGLISAVAKYKVPVITEKEVMAILAPIEVPVETAQKVKCYCSFKCGPRDVKPDDTPFYDEEVGVCFCKKRDQEAYAQPVHECHKKKNVDFPNSCGRKQFFRTPKNIPATTSSTTVPANK